MNWELVKMKILGHSRVIAALSNVRDLPRQINSKAISQNLRSPILQSLQHLRGTKKDAYSGFRASRMSINGADAQRKNIFGDKKIVSNFWQKSSNVSDQKRDALMEKVNDFISRLDNVERVVGKLRNDSYKNIKNNILEARVGRQCEAKEVYDSIDNNIISARWKIKKILQENNLSLHYKMSPQKMGLSQNQYDGIKRDINNIRRDFYSSLKFAKIRLDEINKL
ncbi:hypothetical protein IHE33_14235 (plasmid) [Mycetohabitans endofungorum]